MCDEEANEAKDEINKIRVKTDMVNLLRAGQRSGWTQTVLPPYWLVNNQPGTDRDYIFGHNRMQKYGDRMFYKSFQ